MFASLNEVEWFESTGFCKLGDLELEVLYRITETKKVTARFREKVCQELEGFGQIPVTGLI